MAMIGRRAVLAVLFLCAGAPARAETQDAARRFVEAAYASAVFQARISAIAAGKDTRPEIKALAGRVRDYRAAQLPGLSRLAQASGIEVRDTLDLEMRSIVENMEPLDYLALSRRYAETETQALDREIPAYEEAVRSGPPSIRDYAAKVLGDLRDLGESAREARGTVGP